MGGAFTHINFNLYHYAGNNPVKYVDPDGCWTDNGDGTYTAESGDTLYGLYGEDWQQKSGFNRDPKTLQVGETVGKKNTPLNENAINTTITISESLSVPTLPEARQSSNLQNNLNKAGNILSLVSVGLNFISAACTLTGNVAVAECLDLAAATCDIAAAGLYLASGDKASAAVAVTATLMDFVPGPFKFNKGANRYISSATGKFVSTTLGKQAAIIPKSFGIGLNFLNTK